MTSRIEASLQAARRQLEKRREKLTEKIIGLSAEIKRIDIVLEALTEPKP